MRVADLQPVGDELAIKWADGRESFLRLEFLRRSCPCAGCQGEVDVLGNLHKAPPQPLTPASYTLRGAAPVGGYAVQLTWGDGHASGLYSFEYLRKLADLAEQHSGQAG